MSVAVVAAACAMIAGWVRSVGQVTAVSQDISLVASASAPSTDHTNGLCALLVVPRVEVVRDPAGRKPASSALLAAATISVAERSSHENAIPTTVMSIGSISCG